MRRSRLAALVMLVVLTAISVLADRCLVICHVTEPSAQVAVAEPACHHAAADAGGHASVQGTSACAHDHEGAAFGDSQDSRRAQGRWLVAARFPAPATAVALVLSATRTPVDRLFAPSPPHTGAGLPLRI